MTAVAAFDDDVALRVLAAMRDLGLAAPGDLAVIGFDDNGYGALATPALTTVHIDAEAHGRQAARAVLGLDIGDLSPRRRPGVRPRVSLTGTYSRAHLSQLGGRQLAGTRATRAAAQ